MNILIIAAHPDDEVLGMGGTIAKHTSQHDTVSIIYMATGITGRRELSESEYEIKNILKKFKKIGNKKLENYDRMQTSLQDFLK